MVFKEEYKCLLISDFNIRNFAAYLGNDNTSPTIDPILAPFGQVNPGLLQKDSEIWATEPDFALVWTQPESVVPSFNQVLLYQNVPISQLLAEVDEFFSFLIKLIENVRPVFVPIWVLPSYHRGFGILDLKNSFGISNTLLRMNLRLTELADTVSQIFLLNTQRWVNYIGKKAFNPKLWYMAKIPFGNELFLQTIKALKSAVRGITGQSKKLIVVDLDDTLWGGIVGDLGWQGLKLGGHDYLGEAFADFQRALKSFANLGIQLAIVSKNEESVALEAINKHPEMVLKLEDFAGWRINWDDKAQNIADLVSDLNLGLQSVVFIDDNPVERARVRETLPEVFVPEWPKDKMMYKSTLLSLDCFDIPTITYEDLQRTSMYGSEHKRENLRKSIGSYDEWLKNLDLTVRIEKLKEANLQRTTQLLNKTNQMNLTTRRMGEKELLRWASQIHNELWTCRVTDKYGDSGLTGIISLETNNKKGRIIDFVLSCRVMGRKVEHAMFFSVLNYAKRNGLREVSARYIPTSKNIPCLQFFENSSPQKEGPYFFKWRLNQDYDIPGYIKLEYED